MSHPQDKRERFLIGQHKGERRVIGYSVMFFKSPEEKKRWISRRRNTTTLCNCSMCCNPRRDKWNKKGRLTLQERRFNEVCEN